METLRFLMVSTHFPPRHLGGDAKFVEYLSRELAKRGHEVHVYHSPNVYSLFRDSEQRDSESSQDGEMWMHPYEPRFQRLDPVIVLTMGYWSRAERRLRQLAKEVKPDVVHWHNTRGFIGVPSILSKELSLYTSHDYSAVCPRSNLLKPDLTPCTNARLCSFCCVRWRRPPQLWRMASKRVIRYPEGLRILAPSEFLAERLRKEGVRVHKVLRNFVPDANRVGRGGATDSNSLVYLGMLEKHKGVVTMLRAFTESSKMQEFKLHVIGEGALKRRLQEHVMKHGMADRVTIHGFLSRNEVESIRRSAAAQILPSEWFENAPLTALEAFSLGVPVIGTDIGGIPEIVDNGRTGVIYRYGDARHLGENLIWAWNNRAGLSAMGEDARRSFETRFSANRHISEYMSIINEPR